MKLISGLLTVLALVLSVLFFVTEGTQYNPSVALFSLFCVAFSVFYFILQQRNSVLKREWAKPSNLFLFALIVVYFQQTIDLLLGYKDLSYFVNPNVLNSCNLLSAVGIVSYVKGYDLYREKSDQNRFRVAQSIPTKNTIIILLQLLSFLLFVVHIDIASFLSGRDFSSGYLKSFSLSVYYEYFFQASIIAGLIHVIRNYNGNSSFGSFLSQIPKITLILISVYLLLRLPSGDRGPIIHIVLAVFYAYVFATRAKIKLVFLLLAIVIGGYSISLIGIARNLDLNNSFSDRISLASRQMSNQGRFENTRTFFSPTQELSFSFLSYQVMVDAVVQDDEPYHYGSYQLFHILNVIPFVPGFLANTLHIKDTDLSSSSYATRRYLGDNPNWGLGTNCIGEFFLDLGIIGVLIGMLLTGALFKKIDNSVYIKSKKSVTLAFLATALVYSSRFLSLARGAILQEFREVFLVILILFINKMLLNDKTKLI